MERRASTRVPVGARALLTALGSGHGQWEVTVVDAGGGGVRVSAPAEVAAGSAVELLLDDAILLGEVVHSAADRSGWLAGISVRQSLAPLGGLRRLIAVLVDGGSIRSGRGERVDAGHDRDDEHRGQRHPQHKAQPVSPTASAESRLDQGSHQPVS